ncbi:iron-sulfur cluster assembly accessory protein [Gammaproteobacteria bacterium]|nr:iron-sulfur cluster assembly accessory protein [Gammaproteobacteria bacterium]
MEKFSPEVLTFSDKAIAHFLSSIKNRSGAHGVRIGVKKAGCSGFEYFFDYVDDPSNSTPDDKIFFEGKCTIYVDANSLSYLKGSMVDYSEDGLNKGIKFHNPNAKAVCGCGESFTI